MANLIPGVHVALHTRAEILHTLGMDGLLQLCARSSSCWASGRGAHPLGVCCGSHP